MVRIIKLPSGINLDLEQGETRAPLGRGPIPISHNPETSVNTGRRRWWYRYDDFIGRIGNWIADYAYDITYYMGIGIMVIGGLLFVIWLFTLGWFWGIIAGVVLGGIVYSILKIVVGVFVWVGNILLGAVRYVFYNGWTLIATIVLIIALAVWNNMTPTKADTYGLAEEYTEKIAEIYECRAYELNVRSGPTTQSAILGTLKQGEQVEVSGEVDGFALIRYNERDAYVSMKYLDKIETNTVEPEKP